MRSKIALAMLWVAALPAYRYSFPRDHFSHPEYKTEWWYYTGNLHAASGRRFGFELTFFRAAEDPQQETTPTWRADEVWLAHLALSDLQGHRFFHTARLNRTGPGLAGASQQGARYWNGNWDVRWLAPNGPQELQAVTDDFTLRLRMQSAKPPVIHGQNGISQKGPKPGEASHYISLTRLLSTGQLDYGGQRFTVDGIAWMDHEFFTEQNDTDLSGWDWFAIQLDNHRELMLYRLRLKDGSESPYSSGTFVDEQGNSQALSAADFVLQPGRTWHSGKSDASYPVAWSISVPKLKLQLSETTPLEDQELSGEGSATPTYWEGAVDYNGTLQGQPTRGVGYLEMTGYGHQNRPIF